MKKNLKNKMKLKMKWILEYIWIDGKSKLRSKYKTFICDEISLHNIPIWNYDGSSTYQASTENSEIILQPIAFYKNPFLNDSYLVLCETFSSENPTPTNRRNQANHIFSQYSETEPWFGIEQEYFIMDSDGILPLAFSDQTPAPQGDYYCGVGIKNRDIAEQHYEYCLYAGLDISGINAEVAPSQWEYQIGPCTGIECSDQLWVSRYILQKLSEKYNVQISFCPKPVPSPWNGSGLHTNFSTKYTREKNGLEVIEKYISRLSFKHFDHLEVYGDNSLRLSGECETSDKNEFTTGFGNRGCSIRVPTQVCKEKCGYFEDRRPASDADPYDVTSILYKTCVLELSEEEKFCKERDVLVELLRKMHGKNYDAPGNEHLHPCYVHNYKCNCKLKIEKEIGSSRSSMSVEFW